jgi:hypothetical protein
MRINSRLRHAYHLVEDGAPGKPGGYKDTLASYQTTGGIERAGIVPHVGSATVIAVEPDGHDIEPHGAVLHAMGR